jgi:hypothetical protein
MATPAKKPAEPAKTEASLPEDAKESLTSSSGHGTPEQKARVVESTGGPEQPEQSDPARALADEGARKGRIDIQHAEKPEEQPIVPGNEQTALIEATEKGYFGTQVDETPNEHYTVSGVTSGKPTPENPEGRR